jgi:hypothetical protein
MPQTAGVVRSELDRARSLAEIETIAWLLDNSIPVPGTGGRRLGVDAIIGLVPGIGDVLGGVIGLVVVWRGSRMGVPRIVVARMLANTLLDLAIGSIPVIGDAFYLWFKASTRNLVLIRGWLERPDRSTRGEWLAVLALVVAVAAAVGLVAWLVVAAISALIGVVS